MQQYAVSVICDELIYPLFRGEGKHAESINVRLLCSESDSHHSLLLYIRGIEGDPLAQPYLDELNLDLLHNSCESIVSSVTDSGWEVEIKL